MSTITLTLQNVNGDPATSGSNINITTGTTTGAVFNEPSGTVSLSTVESNDFVTIGGFDYFYEYLGAGDVRNDPAQPAAFIRITSAPPGSPLSVGDTFAIDLSGQPGDPDYPNLQNGNTQLKVANLDQTSPIGFPGAPCFVAGTRVRTLQGTQLVEDVKVGDVLWTLDNGFQTVRWVGCVELDATGDQAPIEFAPGTIGNTRALCVSPQHRVLVQGWQAELICGQDQVLVAAHHLLNNPQVRRRSGRRVRYIHFCFDAHEIVETDGALSESLYVGAQTLGMLPKASALELLHLFPELSDRLGDERIVRRVARRHEASLLSVAELSAA
ncbi:MAG: Hint domain-containing protein [Arenibacterium sp.]